MKAQLFTVAVPVKPSPMHPGFYDWEFAWLLIWIYDETSESASRRALAITALMAYEVIQNASGCRVHFFLGGIRHAAYEADFRAAETFARWHSVSFFLMATETGADFGEFEKEALPS